MASFWRVALTVLIAPITQVIAQGIKIPSTCHTGVQVIALPGSNIANGTYGVSLSLADGILDAIPNSASMTWDYERMFVNDTYTGWEADIENAVPFLYSALEAYAATCPKTPIVLHGYSMGAVVVGNLVCGASSSGFLPTAPLASSWANQIIGIILYGDETRTKGQSYDLSNCTANAPNLPRSDPGGCKAFAPSMQSYCFADDDDCCATAKPNATAPNGNPWHWNYNDYDSESIAFIQTQYNAYVAKNAPKQPAPTQPALPSGIVSLGCYTDSSSRVFPLEAYTNNGTNSNGGCALTCRAEGYIYSGTEYGNECWCGNTAPKTTAAASACNMACSGQSGPNCGGKWALSVQQDTTPPLRLPSGVVAVGCFADSAKRVLPYKAYSGNSTNTQEGCAMTCKKAGYQFSGTENGSQCFCGATAPTTTSKSCTMACSGDDNEVCGGWGAISVNKYKSMKS